MIPGRPLCFAAFTLLAFATPAMTNLADNPTNAPYFGRCETTEICRETSGCISFPTFGTLVLQIDGPTGHLGHEPDDPRPLDIYHALDPTPPAPEDLGLRFLVEQEPIDALTRRFAYVDQTRAGPAGQYFMLDCRESSE